MRRASGFTLIEMMIAMTILAFIAMAVYQGVTQSFQLRDSIERDGDFYNSIRVALDVVNRDVTHLYSPIPAALPGNVGKKVQANPGSDPSQANTASAFGTQAGVNLAPNLAPASKFWGDPQNENGFRQSRLQGEETKLSFVINSHKRLFRDTAESDFAKIEFKLADEKNPLPGQQGKNLIKIEDLDVFSDKDVSDSAIEYVLLPGVKEIKFSYLDSEKDTYNTRWDTNGPYSKGIFPAVIKLELEVYVPNSQNTFKVTQLFKAELSI